MLRDSGKLSCYSSKEQGGGKAGLTNSTEAFKAKNLPREDYQNAFGGHIDLSLTEEALRGRVHLLASKTLLRSSRRTSSSAGFIVDGVAPLLIGNSPLSVWLCFRPKETDAFSTK